MLEKIKQEFLGMKDMSWVCGVCGGAAALTCCFLGPFTDARGPLVLGLFASSLTVSYPFALAHCSTYWQFMLCIGAWRGIAKGFCMSVAAPMSRKLFDRRAAFAQAAIMAGSSMGGEVYSQYFKQFFPGRDWEDTMFIYA